MSHILKKMQIAGGGKRRNEPKPPIYKPPVMGELQYGASYSYSEILDLISDGPIEGLCNRFGRVMEGIGMLQGIYLDDTPVAVTQGTEDIIETNPELVTDTLEVMPSRLSDAVGTGIKNCQLFFKALNQQKRRSSAGLITALRKGGTRGPILDGEVVTLPDVNMMMVRERTKSSKCSDRHPRDRGKRGIYYRAYIRKELEGAGSVAKTFYLNTNGNSRPEYGSNSNAVYRNATEPEGQIKSVGWMDNPTYNKNIGFPAGTASLTTKFAIGYGGDNMGFVSNDGRRLWHETEWFLARVANGFEGSGGGLTTALRTTNNNVCAMSTISRLYSDNSLEGASSIAELIDWDWSEKNAYQGALAQRALGRGGWFQANGTPLVMAPGGHSRNRMEQWMERSANTKAKSWTVIVKVDEDNPDLAGKSLIDADGELIHMFTYPYGLTHGWNLYFKMRNAGIRITDFTCPVVDKSGIATGKMYGFLLFSFRPSIRQDALKCSGDRWGIGTNFAISKEVKDLFSDLDCFKYSKEIVDVGDGNTFDIVNQKYNYTNVLAEFRAGTETQTPFDFFKAVFIDHKYAAPLFGPFSSKSGTKPQRIQQNEDMLTKSDVLKKGSADNYNLNVGGDGLPQLEGSDDEREGGDNVIRDYGSWAKNSLVRWDEMAIPVTHYIYNPNVRRCFITLNISSLSDTLIREVNDVGGADTENNDLKIGTKFPTVLNVRVETGRVGKDGSETPKYTHTYRIVALVEGATLIDIGNPDYKADRDKEYVVSLDSSRTNLAMPFRLPQAVTTKEVLLNAQGTQGIQADSIDQDSVEKRYIRVTKLSYETNSVLLSKEVSLDKVTEIIDVDLPYPFSSIVGTKLDSRAFGAIPARSFDCKLKKVKLPSNYFPQSALGQDRRYWSSKATFNSITNKQLKSVYHGDWDGTFHEELMWTDNPAWILYDLLVSQRYGMGSHIDKDTINIWQLYEIGRFCDAVDDSGYFEGVTDGRGGLEPRFSCNIVFEQGEKIYDAINTIAGIFRGRTFFANSEVNFVDDRPRSPINLFTNESVKDGQFFYANNRRDEQYNTIEVGFKDRFDNFAPKIEVVENEEDIRERGIFKKRIEGVGITSRAMARRVGQHQIFSKITENQTVAFTAGLETLLCQPGDLISIEDELKTNKSNFGKILAVNLEDETIRLSNTFVEADMTGRLTVFNPTGRNTLADMGDVVDINRERYQSFTITGSDAAPADMWASGHTSYTGSYGFSGYTEGYSGATRADTEDEERFEQYAMYTGAARVDSWDYPYIYFETGVTGWVFASGIGVGDLPDARSLYSGNFISQLTGMQALMDFGTGNIAVLDMGKADKRSDPATDPTKVAAFSGFDDSSFSPSMPTRGPWNPDVPAVLGPDQMSILNVTGAILSTPSQLEASGLNPYGSLASGFDKPELLPFVKLGSPAKFEIKDASPFIYKVVSMKEEAPNEYLVSATKYETGKFKLIEDNISIEHKSNTYSYQTAQTINGITYTTLDTPVLASVTTGIPDPVTQTFNITGRWGEVSNVTGYNVILTYPNGQTIDAATTYTGYSFTGLTQVGVFNYSVNSLGNKASSLTNGYFDSQYDTSGLFVVYDELLVWSTNFLNRITII
tara:strand:- start:1455 stop:6290 length:4836 start_codon:yes stop_codon:yes gene_type:complete